MDPEDLQTLILPQMDGTVNALLYDPMPGGSGLIDQMLDSWETIINVGVETLAKCPGNCPKSCYSCMKSYRNLFHHENLDRNVAIQVLRQYGGPAKLLGKVPPKTGAQTETGKNTNTAEMRLDKWLKDHGFTEFVANKRIELPKGRISHTIPDFYYESVGRKVRCAIYLDGLSKAIHGNEDRKHLDEYIRAILETMSVRVIVVAASHLDDPEMMDMLMARLSQAMNG
jgi:hypothetical protein